MASKGLIYLFVTVGLMVAVFVVDLFTPLGYAEWALYVIPLILTVKLQRPSAPLVLAAVSTALIVAGYFFSPPGITGWMAIHNRLMGVVVLWAVAGFVYAQKLEYTGKVYRKGLALPSRFPGYLSVCRFLASRSVAIVNYHGVSEKPLPVFNWCQMSVKEFEAQLEFLSREYTVLSLPEVIARLERQLPLPDRTVCLTFDDGYRNVFTTAFPIMKRYDLPSTVFLITGLIGTRQPAWPEHLFHAIANTWKPYASLDGGIWPLESHKSRALAFTMIVECLKKMDRKEKDEKLKTLLDSLEVPVVIQEDSPLALLDWDEVLQLHKTSLVSFGSHTHTHEILSRIPSEAQYDELRNSRDVLLDRLGTGDFFAYPNGTRADFTDTTKRLVCELGYHCALTTLQGLNPRNNSDVYELRRIGVGADTTIEEFERRMAGL
nr:polysaccharide deacetylase family protein [Nitrospirota bacterium]